MKILLKLGLVLTLLLQGTAFAQTMGDKYTFPTLEQVPEFRMTNMESLEVIDSRTLFVDIAPNKSYLLVLRRSLMGLQMANNVELSTSNNDIKAGIDYVTAHDQGEISATIETIYVLPDRESRRMVRDRLVGSSYD